MALIAATALAIGGVSAVAAHALTSPTLAGSATNSTASLIVGNYTSEVIAAGGADKYYTISNTGGTINYPAAPSNTTLTGGANEVWSAGTGAIGTANFAGSETMTVSVYSATAGTQVVTLTGSTSTIITLTITWGAPPALSAANSFVVANNAADIASTTIGTTANTLKVTAASADSSIIAVGTTAGVLAGGATIGLYNNATPPVSIATDTIYASVSGPGLVTISKAVYSGAPAVTGTVTTSGTSTLGKAVTTTTAAAYGILNIYSDGTVGTSTVTISDATAGVVLGTVSIVFYATVISKLVAVTNTNIPLTIPTGFVPTATESIRSNAVVAGQAAVTVVASDATGNAIPSAVGITVTSGTPAVATVGALTYDAANASSFVNVTPVSEGTTVLTFADAATGKVVATTTVMVVSPVVAKVVASTDAATYAQGTKVLYSLNATDAAGNPVADGTYTGLFTSVPTSNIGLQGALPSTGAVVFKGGVSTSTLYAPVAGSNVVIAGGTLSALPFVATAAAGTTTNSALFSVNAGTVVTGPGTIQAAIDAAVAATTAATAAGVQATAAVTAANAAGVQAAAAVAGVAVVNTRLTALLSKVAALIKLMARLIKKAHA